MIIVYFVSFICVWIALYTWKKEKSLVNPVTVFGVLWATIFFLSNLQLYTMIKPQNSTYEMLSLGIFSFFIGYYIQRNLMKNISFSFGKKYKFGRGKYEIRYQLVYILIFVCILFSVYNLYRVITSVGLFSLANVQDMLQEGEFKKYNSKYITAFSWLIITPLGFAIPAIAAADFWYGKREKKLFIFTLILLLLRMLSNANRSSFIMFFIFLVVGGLEKSVNRKKQMNDKRKKANVNAKKWVKYFIVTGIVFFVLMTISRSALLFRNLYLNFAMPVRMFEIWKDKVDTEKTIGYGCASFNGYINMICYLLRNFLGVQTPTGIQKIYDMIQATDQQWQWVGLKIHANAYVSLFWTFYLDLREWGITIGSFLYGIFCSRKYMRLKSNSDIRCFSVYCIVFYGVLFSFVRFQFSSTSYALGIVYVLILLKRIPNREDK